MKKLLCFVIMILIFGGISGCNPTDIKEEKVRFDYSMSALTVAADRAYAEATGGDSTVILSEEYLADLPVKLGVPSDYPLWPYKKTTSFVTAVTINDILEFEIESESVGNLPDVIGDYCGEGPYKVKIVWYCTESRTVEINENAQELIKIYDSALEPDPERQFLIIEGSSGEPLFYENAGGEYLIISGSTERKYYSYYYNFGMRATTITEKNNIIESPYDETALIVIKTKNKDGKMGFLITDDVWEMNKQDTYSVNEDSIKLYEINEKYTIPELLLPAWYTE